MDIKPIIYIVDDDESILLTLESLISKIFPNYRIHTVGNGLEAWEMIKNQKAKFIIISDVYMPELNGLQLLKMMRGSELIKNNYFIMMSSANETDLNLKALQMGADDFFVKPIKIDQLLSKLRLTIRLLNSEYHLKQKDIELQKKNEEMINRSNTIKDVFINFQNARIQGFSNLSEQIIKASLWIAEQMGIDDEEELEAIRNACQLIYVGKMHLPENKLKEKVYLDGVLKNEDFKNIPINGKNTINTLPGYTRVANILGSIYENFDGSGIPEKKIGWEIPVGSRIIRVVMDFFELIGGEKSKTSKALQTIEKDINKLYELKVVALFDQYTAFVNLGGSSVKETSLENHEVIEHLVITRNVYTESGMKIIGAGVSMTQEMVDRFREITRNENIIGKVWIRK